MNDLDFIKKFSKISIKKVCRDNGVDSSNLWSGRVSNKKIRLIRKGIEFEISKIYKEDYEQQKNNSL